MRTCQKIIIFLYIFNTKKKKEKTVKRGHNQPGEGFILTANKLGYPIKQVLIFGVDVQSALLWGSSNKQNTQIRRDFSTKPPYPTFL